MTIRRVTLTPYIEPSTARVPEKAGGKLIVQVARTNCAGAIWRIHDAINQYTEHTCRTITVSNSTNGRRFPHDVLFSQSTEVRRLLSKADVIHFHTWIDYESREMAPYLPFVQGKRMVIQYHTEPSLVQRHFRRDIINREDIATLVIAQKHVRYYPKSLPVPNMIDIRNELLTPTFNRGAKLRVIYTPSDIKSYGNHTNTCCGKGYTAVTAVLSKLQGEGLIESSVITDKNWEQLMPIKRTFDVCIDECVTGGYHLCSLEALSQGLVTIAWLDDQTKQAIHKIVGKETELPWVNTTQVNLESTLRNLAANPTLVAERKIISRKWMEENWDPKVLVQHFLKAYWPAGIPKSNNFQTQVKPPVIIQPQSWSINKKWGNRNTMEPVYDAPGVIQRVCQDLSKAWTGRRVIIWGNGPSVSDAVALRGHSWFKGVKNIGTNAASKLDGINFDVYCIGDRRFMDIPEKKEIAMNAPGIRIYESTLLSLFPEGFDASFIKVVGRDGFCSDLNAGCYHGYSVAYFALQVALWTGSKDILLAGCGHSYDHTKPRFYKEDRVSPVDDNFQKILNNYRHLLPALVQSNVSVRTIGKSRLIEAGIKQFLP